MLQLRSISLVHFRNYTGRKFEFAERITGVCGMNGTGKTNFLDAIYYTSFTKSYFSRPDQLSVHHGLQGMRIEGHYLVGEEPYEVVCILRENNRKEFMVNDEAYQRLSEHIGRFPCVMIAPDDIALVSGGSEERRRFIDTLLSQCVPGYLSWLIAYTRLLQQRNGFLKNAAQNQYADHTLLDTLDEQLAEKGALLFEARNTFLETFIPLVKECYRYIAGKDDALGISYESGLLNAGMMELLRAGRQRDLLTQRTGAGIHRDELELGMGDQPFKTLASQGQRKSLLFALKLAEFETLRQQKGFSPLLLLDDVFEKLDAGRMRNLLHKVCVEEQGQVFITDTHADRLSRQLDQTGVPYALIEL